MKYQVVQSKRPPSNPMVRITFTGTLCLVESIAKIVVEMGYINGDDFIRSALRTELLKSNCIVLKGNITNGES